MRLFIAVQLSDEMKKTITGTLHNYKKMGIKGNYVPMQNLHMTLAFIGEVTSAEGIKEAMKTVRYSPFRLSLTETGTFGDLLWIGAKGNQGMKSAVRDLRSALDAAGISYDKKEFQPHITLIRKVSGNVKKNLPFEKSEMMVKKISLMKSTSKDGKMVYTEIFSI